MEFPSTERMSPTPKCQVKPNVFFNYQRLKCTTRKSPLYLQNGNTKGKNALKIIWELLASNGCHAWKGLTLYSLKQSTAAGRDVAYLVSKSELVHTSYRVATTDK